MVKAEPIVPEIEGPLPVVRKKRRPNARADTPEKLARMRAKMGHASKSLAALRAARKADPPAGAERTRNYGRGISSVEMLLSAKELGDYYELLRRPTTTLAIAHEWVRSLGHRIGFNAIQRHRARFRERLAEQRQAAEVSHMINTVALERGTGGVTDASATYVEQQMILSLRNCLRATQEGQPFDPELWIKANKAVGEAVRNRGAIEKIRKFLQDFAPKKPFDGFKVALVMREMLGIPPPPVDRVIAGKVNVNYEAQAAEAEAYKKRYDERLREEAAAEALKPRVPGLKWDPITAKAVVDEG